MYEKADNTFYLGLGTVLLAILTGVVGLLLLRTGMAAAKGKICVPGH